MKTTLPTTQKILATLTVLATLVCGATKVQATSYVAVKSGNWNNAAIWAPGNVIPTATDTATISNAVTVGVSTTITAPALTIVTNSGVLQLVNGGTGTVFGNLLIQSNATLNSTINGTFCVIGGSLTNFGLMEESGGNNGTPDIYTNGNGFLVGNVSNMVVNVTGTYTNLGTLFIGQQASTGLKNDNPFLTISGNFVNLSSIYVYGGSSFPASGLNLSAAPNSVTLIGQGSGFTAPSTPFYDLNWNDPGNNTFGSPTTVSNNFSYWSNPNPWGTTINAGSFFWDSPGSSTSTSSSQWNMWQPLFTLGGFGTAPLVLTGNISDNGHGYSLVKLGPTNSTVSLNPSAAESYSGNTIINGGALTLNYTSLSAANMLNSSSSLVFGSNYCGGGNFMIMGKSSTAISQTFNGLNLLGGGNVISNVLVGTSTTLALGAVGRPSYGGNVDFNATGSTTTTPITTSTGNSSGILGPWATVAGANWATITGNDIVALSSYTGALPTTGGTSSDNDTMAAGITLGGSVVANTLNISTASSLALGNNTLTLNGVMSSANATISDGTGYIGAGTGEFDVYTKAGTTLTISINANSTGLIGTGAGGLVKSGAGTLALNSGSTSTLGYTGPTVVHQGTLSLSGITSLASTNIQVDAPATITDSSATLTLTGMTLTGNGTIVDGSSPLTFGSGTTIAPGGLGQYGVLTLQNSSGNGLVINSGTVLIFNFSRDPDYYPTNNYISAVSAKNSELIYNGQNSTITMPSILNVTINMPDGILGYGRYVLIACLNGQGFGSNPVVNPTWTGGSAPTSYSFSYISSPNGIPELVLDVYNPAASCTTPNGYSVTGGTGCSSPGVSVGLSSSDTGINYQLYNGSTPVGTVVSGTTGTPITFGTEISAGTYTVWATNTSGGCSLLMSGNAIVSQSANTTYNVTGGNACSSSGSTIGLSSSDIGVSYQLLLNGTQVGSSVNGTGSAITFGLQTAAGTYTVQGTNTGCGIVAISGGSPSSVVITATPGAPTSPSTVVSNSTVTVSWSAPGSGPTPTGYNLYRSAANGASGSESLYLTNVVSPYSDTNLSNGDIYYYKVSALNGTCEGPLSAEVGGTPNASYSGYIITGGGSVTAGGGESLTITAVNSDASTATSISGPILLTFSGLASSPGGTAPTFNGTAGSTTATFSSGVATVTLVAYDAQSGTLAVTDGTHASGSPGGAPLGLTVSPATASAYRISAATTTPVVGSNDVLTINQVDQYQNVQTSLSGNTSLTFAGLSTGPNGTAPSVNGTALGTATSISFTNGSSTATLVATKVESSKQLTATDGTLTAAGTGGTAPILSPTVGAAAQLSITTQPSSTATVGTVLAQQPVIAVQDAFGNPVTTSSASVNVSPSVGNVTGTHPVTAVSGVATFSGLSLTNAGSVTLTFSSTGLASTNSTAITVGAGAYVGLGWITQPGAAVYSTAFGTAPVLATVDQYGNATTTGIPATLVVTVTNSSGPGTLLGTTSYNIGSSGSNGVVTFTGLSITNATGTNYQLMASATGNTTPPVTGYSVWLDSSIASSVMLSSSGNVTNWLDQSGNGNNFTNLGSAQGIYYTNNNTAFSGRKTVTFVNGNELWNTTYNNGTTPNLSFFVVYKETVGNNNAYERAAATWAGNTGNADYQNNGSFNFDTAGGDTQVRAVRNEGANGDLNGPTVNFHTNYFINEFFANSSSNALYVNGIFGAQNTGGAGANFTIAATSVGGGVNPGGAGQNNGGMGGDIAELLIYNSRLTPAQQTNVEGYLLHKWTQTPYTVSFITATTATFTVAPAPITITGGITAASRAYNGTTNAALTIGTVTFSGVFSQDTGIIGINAAGAGGYFANPGPGVGIPVTVTNILITGSDETNYTVAPLILAATITSPVGGYNAFAITDADSGVVTAGQADQLTITAETNGVVATNVNGDVTLTFSGLSAAPNGSAATVTDLNGTPQPFGTPTTFYFTNGVASLSGEAVLVPLDAQTATLHATDGTYGDGSPGGSTATLTVSPAADNAYRISPASSTPQAGSNDVLTINIVDQYQNQSATATPETITFGGLSNSANGATPTVNGTPLGTGTPISFTAGSATATLVAVKTESNKLLTAINGSITAAATGGFAPTLSPTAGSAASLGITTQPSSTAAAGVPFAQQPVITVLDAYLNPVTASSASVNVSPSVDNISGPHPTNAVNGVATFSGLSLTNVGVNTLTFTSAGLTPTNSTSITVSSGQISGLAWLTQPGAAVYGSTFGSPGVVGTVDQYGNPTTNGLGANLTLTIALASGGGTLSGTTSYNIGTAGSNGVVSLNDLLVLNGSGLNYQLTASIPSGAGTPVGGASLWLDANATNTITLIGGTNGVAGWANEGSAGLTLIPPYNQPQFGSPAFYAPQLINNSLNGRPIVRFTTTATGGGFNAASEGLEQRWPGLNGLNGNTNVTLFMVVRQNAASPDNWGGIMGFANTNAAAGKSYDTLGEDAGDEAAGNGFRFFRNDTTAPSPTENASGQYPMPAAPNGGWDNPLPATYGNAFVNEFMFDANANPGNAPASCAGVDDYVDSAGNTWSNYQASTVSAATYGAFDFQDFAIGGQLGEGGTGFATDEMDWGENVDVAEVLMYTNRLSDASRAAVKTYLQNKWLTGAYFSPAASASSATFTVAQATLTITNGITANGKLYDGTTNVILTIGTIGFTGVIPQDGGAGITLNTNGLSAGFANPGPGNAVPVIVAGILPAPAGTVATNYIVAPLVLSATIIQPVPPFSAFTVTDAGAGHATAGVGDQLTISTVDTTGTVQTNINGSVNVTFSGLSAAPDGSQPTVTDLNGTPQPFGTATLLLFTNGVASQVGEGLLVAHDVQTATPHLTAGTNTDADAGGSTVSITVSTGPDAAYRISANTSTPQAGAGDALTLNLVDQYQNPSSTTGSKSLTFGGLSAGPDGSLPTVNGTAFGTGTVISFSGGTASASLVAHKVESGKLLTATDGTLSAAGPVGTAPTLSPTAGAPGRLGISTEPSATVAAGVALAQQPVITVLDTYGNPTASSSTPVSVSAAVGSVSGAFPTNSTGGVAAFSGLTLTGAGTNTLTFSSAGLSSTNSTLITIRAGAYTGLAWTTQPGAAVYGSKFGIQPVLATADQYGNATTNGIPGTLTVNVTKSSGPGTLSGTLTYDLGSSASNGVVSFSDLAVTNATGTNYQLTAATPSGYGAPVSGMAVWLDGSVASSVTTSGGNVTQWNDLSGNNYNFGLAAGSGNITYSSTLNGLKVVTFPGGPALLTTNNAYTDTGSNVTIFCVVRTTSPSGYSGPFSSTAGNNDNDWNTIGSWSLNAGGSGQSTFQRYYTSVSSPTTWTANTPFIFEGADDSVGDNQYAGYDDGTVSNLVSGTPDTQAAFDVVQLAVGARLAGTNQIMAPWTGDVAEVLLYNSYLSASQQASVMSYLNNKWLSSGSFAPPVSATTVTFTVGPAPITVTNGITANNKVYDGTTNATLTIGTVGFTGVYPQDQGIIGLNTSGAGAYFTSAGPGNNIPVTVTNLVITGSDATNYYLAPLGLSANITSSSATLTVTLNASESPSGYRDSVSFTGTVSPSVAGSIVFATNGVPFDTEPLSGGSATSVATAALPRGTNTVTATYTGNPDYTGLTNLLQVVTNHPPVLNAANYSRIGGLELQIKLSDLLTNASDADNDTLSLGYITPSTNGTTLTSDGTYLYYTNSAPPNVSDAFNYYVNDGFGGLTTNTVFLTVDNSQTGQPKLSAYNAGGHVQVSFAGLPRYAYYLQRSTNLTTGAGWVPISTNNTTSNVVFTVTDSFPDIGSTPKVSFYRVFVP